MQWNPGKWELTGRLFRGFGIRERAHFHPVGQAPGGKCHRGRRQEGNRQATETERGEERTPEKELDMKERSRKHLGDNETLVRHHPPLPLRQTEGETGNDNILHCASVCLFVVILLL